MVNIEVYGARMRPLFRRVAGACKRLCAFKEAWEPFPLGPALCQPFHMAYRFLITNTVRPAHRFACRDKQVSTPVGAGVSIHISSSSSGSCFCFPYCFLSRCPVLPFRARSFGSQSRSRIEAFWESEHLAHDLQRETQQVDDAEREHALFTGRKERFDALFWLASKYRALDAILQTKNTRKWLSLLLLQAVRPNPFGILTSSKRNSIDASAVADAPPRSPATQMTRRKAQPQLSSKGRLLE